MDGHITPRSRPPLGRYLTKLLTELSDIFVNRGGSYADFADNASVSQDLRRALGQENGLDTDDFTVHGVEMIRHKLSRLASNGWGHRDSWMDLAGFALLVAACQDRKAEMSHPTLIGDIKFPKGVYDPSLGVFVDITRNI